MSRPCTSSLPPEQGLPPPPEQGLPPPPEQGPPPPPAQPPAAVQPVACLACTLQMEGHVPVRLHALPTRRRSKPCRPPSRHGGCPPAAAAAAPQYVLLLRRRLRAVGAVPPYAVPAAACYNSGCALHQSRRFCAPPGVLLQVLHRRRICCAAVGGLEPQAGSDLKGDLQAG